METTRVINLTFQICGSIMSLGIVIGIFATKLKTSVTDTDYCNLLISTIFVLMSDALAYVFRGRLGIVPFIGVRSMNFISFLSQNIQALLFLRYQQHFFEQKLDIKISERYFQFGIFTVCGSAVLLMVNTFYPIVYTFGDNNTYSRMPMYPLISVLVLACFGAALLMFLRYMKCLTRLEYLSFILVYIVPALTGIINSVHSGIVVSQMGATLGIVVLFFIVQEFRGRYVAEQENALLKSSTLLTLSQIQPHFLFNALNSIEFLCVADPEKAEHAVNHLSRYLRENMASISSSKPIPFSQELEHVKNYLYIEQIRFPHIEIRYDLQEMNFSIPSLTVQPLVENAIKHGLKGVKSGGYVIISSRRMHDCYLVSIEDNGCGFDPEHAAEASEDGRQHIGIENVRQRLRIMCNGTLSINSTPEGTAVEVRIPLYK